MRKRKFTDLTNHLEGKSKFDLYQIHRKIQTEGEECLFKDEDGQPGQATRKEHKWSEEDDLCLLMAHDMVNSGKSDQTTEKPLETSWISIAKIMLEQFGLKVSPA